MNIIAKVVIATSVIFMAACEHTAAANAAAQIANMQAEASGSPFRWKIENTGDGATMTSVMIDLPLGTTKADDVLTKDILSQIEKTELSQQRPSPKVQEVRLLLDGREVWILESKNDGVAYVVTMKASSQGGTDFAIDGPTLFQKKANHALETTRGD